MHLPPLSSPMDHWAGGSGISIFLAPPSPGDCSVQPGLRTAAVQEGVCPRGVTAKGPGFSPPGVIGHLCSG